MGTYIYAFIETYEKDGKVPPFSDPTQIYSITQGSFNLHRDYDVFDALAFGREATADPEDRDPTREPKFQPRGMPAPCSLDVAHAFFYVVCDPGELPDRYFWPRRRCISRGKADKWVQAKGCVQSEVIQWFNTGNANHLRWSVVSEPLFYNASWLWPHEFDEALQHHGLALESRPVDYSALRKAMELLEQHYGRERVRLVVWFS